ncbi:MULTISPECIES: hypothetical protein [unclassified Tatumella]|uniref:hypothetical protein n=1 Tax=unclassified Tatumella TaxID=2649542 RepID=UPI001BAF0F7E|nr:MULTISPECIES: hypothetical protein [unclassified Tatumella]MBS0878008.1 hypothetical protein [Tatumella sp. JGM82]MBS0891269.1 hypothetical protein [Tatumella sp. JGM94]MBS0902648.1 hypothetical protein [Tatumella sp. JGM100]
MSGLQVISQSSIMDSANSVTLPAANDALAGAYFFSAGAIGKNYGAGPLPVVNGTLTQKEDFGAAIDETNFIDTQITPGANGLCIISLVKVPASFVTGDAWQMVGTWGEYDLSGNDILGNGLALADSQIYSLAGAAKNNVNGSQSGSFNAAMGVSTQPVSAGQVKLFSANCGVTATGIINTVEDMLSLKSDTKTLNNDSSNTYSMLQNRRSTIKLGRYGDYKRSTDTWVYDGVHYAHLIFDRLLTDAELKSVGIWLKNYASKRGLTIV